MEVPSVLLVSCCPAFVEEALVRDIIGADDLPEYTGPGNEVRSYPWTIDNKYYTATVQVCVVPNQFTLTAEIADTVEAFLIYFDSTTKSGLDEVSTWLPLTQAWTPEVLILVCDRVSDNGVSRQKAQQWCIKYGFELVELNPEELPDEEDDFPESTGVTRIIQALNANVWSNVEMKTDRPQDFGILSSLTGVLENCETEAETQVEYQSLLEPDAESHAEASDREAAPQPDSVIADPMLHLDIQELATLTTGEVDCENFERLFEKLKEMKDKAATLPHEQRKLHAEKVAKAFWMAIGGDREEIEEPSDEEND